jgi:hypothetical protein
VVEITGHPVGVIDPDDAADFWPHLLGTDDEPQDACMVAILSRDGGSGTRKLHIPVPTGSFPATPQHNEDIDT